MGIISHTEIDGNRVLAISTGLSEYAAAKSRLQRGTMGNGYLVSSGGQVQPWISEGSFCRDASRDARVHHGGIVHLYGPDFDGIPLLDIINTADSESAWRQVFTAISSIYRAGKTAGEYGEALLSEAGQTGPGGILLARDGSILVLGETYRRCLASQGDSTDRENRLEWVHPDCAREPSEKNLSFLFATLAYRIAGGVSPFMSGELWSLQEKSGDTEASFIAHLARGKYVVNLATIRPEATRAFTDTVMKILAGDHPDGISAMLAFGESFRDLVPGTHTTENEAVIADRDASLRSMKIRLARTVFIRKHSTKFILTGIIAGFFAVFLSMYVSDLRAKPDTTGMESNEVVRAFYGAVARLDADTITSFATSRAAKEYTHLVSGMYMTNRILGRDEITGKFTDPQRLFREILNASHTVYGITRLELEDTGSAGDRAEYLVSFYLFLPEETRETDGLDLVGRAEQPLTVYRYRDRIELTRKNDRWKIMEIEQLERAVEEASGRKIFNTIATGEGDTLPYAPR